MRSTQINIKKRCDAIKDVSGRIINLCGLLHSGAPYGKISDAERDEALSAIKQFTRFLTDGFLHEIGEFEWDSDGGKIYNYEKRPADLRTYYVFDPLGNLLFKVFGIRRLSKRLSSAESTINNAIFRRNFIRGVYVNTENVFNPLTVNIHTGTRRRSSHKFTQEEIRELTEWRRKGAIEITDEMAEGFISST